MRTALHRSLAGLAVAGLTAALVTTGSAAHAGDDVPTAPVLDPFTNTYSFNGEGNCDTTDSQESDDADVPVAANSGPTSVTSYVSTAYQFPIDVDDTVVTSSRSTTTGSLAVVNGTLSTIDFSTTGTASIDTALPESGCFTEAATGADLRYPFTVGTAGFLDVTLSQTAQGYGDFEIDGAEDAPDEPYWEAEGGTQRFAGTHAVYLVPGDYVARVEGDVFVQGTTDQTSNPTTTAHAEFHLPGVQLTTPVGRAVRYAGLATTRSCASNTLTQTVTGAVQAKKIRNVRVYVNDQLTSKAKKPTPGQVVDVPIPASPQRVTVRTLVKLKAKKHQHGKAIKGGKSYQSLTTYEPCA